jgi:Xaa-Pro aminopeptidase
MDRYVERITLLRKSFSAQKIDALLVSKPENIFYLSGFRGDDSFLLITAHSKVILSDSRYETELRNGLKGWRIMIRSKGQSLVELIKALMKKKGLKTLGFDPSHISYYQYRLFRKALSTHSIKPCYRFIENLRLVKDDYEIMRIRDSVRIAESSLHILRNVYIDKARTEKELADVLEYTLRTQGAESAAFPSIVASAERSALPHAVSGRKKIKRHTPLLIDFGAKKDGYCSDLTRTFFLGKITARFRKLYFLVREAQQLAISIIKAGIEIGAVDKQVRHFFRLHKLDDHFIHALGHGIGLEVHESPSLIYTSREILKENMVLTVEPGLYFNDWGGIRIEDIVRVTAGGCERLSECPLIL